MYSDKKNILQLVALLRAHGVTQVVLCPGSRNAPLIHTLSTHPDFTCYSVTDERSAGFFALGLALNADKPAAVCCTSGTALLNLHPAVAEAYYQQVPLVVISADRPAAWIGQMDGQTLPQPEVFRTLVRKSVNLPEIHTEEDEWFCNRLVNEALLEVDHRGKGPVHINIPLSEPLFRFSTETLPEVRVVSRYLSWKACKDQDKDLLARLNGYGKRMVIAGQHRGNVCFAKELEAALSGRFTWLAEHIGNRAVPAEAVRNFDTALYAMSEEMKAEVAPDLLITYGGHIVSKRLKKLIRENPPKEHWHISPDGEIADLFGALTTVFEMEPFEFLQEVATVLVVHKPDYPRMWKNLCTAIPLPDLAYSEMSAIGALLNSLPENSVLHLANSSSIRYAQLYTLHPTIEAYGNRGTSGIEGSLSTTVGYAAASDKLNFVVIGDLSFFYDMNALWNNHLRTSLRILLLNNGGGEIFQTLPGLEASGVSHRFITATHQTTAKGWAEERGFRYRAVAHESELAEAISFLAQPEHIDQPVLVEVFTDKDADTRILKDYYHQLKQV